MSQQGGRPTGQEDDWWGQLYDSADDTGPAPAPDTLDDRFASAAGAVRDGSGARVGTADEAAVPHERGGGGTDSGVGSPRPGTGVPAPRTGDPDATAPPADRHRAPWGPEAPSDTPASYPPGFVERAPEDRPASGRASTETPPATTVPASRVPTEPPRPPTAPPPPPSAPPRPAAPPPQHADDRAAPAGTDDPGGGGYGGPVPPGDPAAGPARDAVPDRPVSPDRGDARRPGFRGGGPGEGGPGGAGWPEGASGGPAPVGGDEDVPAPGRPESLPRPAERPAAGTRRSEGDWWAAPPAPGFDRAPGPDPRFGPVPGPDSGFAPAPGPDPRFGPTPGPDSGLDPGPGPDSGFDPAPGPDPAPRPDSGSGPISGSGPDPVSAPGLNPAPAPTPGATPIPTQKPPTAPPPPTGPGSTQPNPTPNPNPPPPPPTQDQDSAPHRDASDPAPQALRTATRVDLPTLPPAPVGFVGSGPPTYDAEPTALPPADPDELDDLVADTVLDGARYGACTLRAVSVRGDSARFRGEPRRDSLLTARFGTGDQALILVAMATGARATPGAHRAAAEACHWIGRAVGRSHARLAQDIGAARRGDLKSGLHRLTDRSLGKLRASAVEQGIDPEEYAASLRCLLLPADPDCRVRVFFGVGAGGLFRLRDGAWHDIEPQVTDLTGEPVVGFGSLPPETPDGDRLTMDLGIPTPPSPYEPAPEPPREAFRFRASVARPGDALLMCTSGLAEPLRGEAELREYLTGRWSDPTPPGLAAFFADSQVRVKGYADDRTAAAVWEA
ncbi:protein phosphatase 2C domain-containing protein [Streptomyces pseudovenezuelae]|uniref:Protein phosphatase 2C domain-containing protein n=2 Tax=Streptomyces TaxID=1883 RepID=A0ABZ1X4Y8_9ACTN|nr:protein phosphatase 2C domain-containing protein [Streptomyces pseudovenezuelae]